MKKILHILTALVLLASCQKDNAVQSHDKAVATFEVQTPFEFEIKSTTGSGTGSKINALWYGVYHKKADGRFVYMSDMSDFVQVTDINDISVPITLFKDQEYKIIFVAQHIEAVASVDGNVSNCYTYIINENGQMSLNPSAVITDGEQLDAFVYWEQTGVIKNDYKKEIELERPLAQINIATSSDNYPSTLNIAVSGAAESYNIFTGEYSDDTAGFNLNNIEVPANDNDKITVSGKEYNRLATLYCLGSNRLSITMTDPSNAYGAFSIESIPTQANYKTNVVGALGYGRIVEVADASAFIAALNNVEEGDLIRLTADFSSVDSSVYEFNYAGNKSFTIDLNDKKIQVNVPNDKYLLNFTNATSAPNIITIKNGIMDAAFDAFGVINANGKITINLENVKISNNDPAGSTVKLTNAATLNVKSGTEINGTCSLYVIDCDASTANIYAGEIILNSATSNDAYLIRAVNKSIINIYGGELWAFEDGDTTHFYSKDDSSTINENATLTSLQEAPSSRHCEEHSPHVIARSAATWQSPDRNNNKQ